MIISRIWRCLRSKRKVGGARRRRRRETIAGTAATRVQTGARGRRSRGRDGARKRDDSGDSSDSSPDRGKGKKKQREGRSKKKRDSSSSSSSSDSSSESSSDSSSDSSRSRSRDRTKKDKKKKSGKDKAKAPKAGKEPASSPVRKESKTKDDKPSVKAAPEKPRERSRSKPGPRGRARSGSPPSTKIHIGRLTRNVNREHLQEIFSTFGKIREIEFGSERMRPWLNKGFAYIEFENSEDAKNALRHMDGGQIDGQEVTAAPVLVPRIQPRRRSPPRRR